MAWSAKDFEDDEKNKKGTWSAKDFESSEPRHKQVTVDWNAKPINTPTSNPALKNRAIDKTREVKKPNDYIKKNQAVMKQLLPSFDYKKVKEEEKLNKAFETKYPVPIIKESPKFENIPKHVSAAAGFGDSSTLGLLSAQAKREDNAYLPTLDKSKPSVKKFLEEAKRQNPKSYLGGQVAGYFVPGIASEKVAAAGMKGMIKGLPILAQKAITGAAAGAGQELVEGVNRGESAGNIAKRTVIGGVAGGVADPLLSLAGKGIKKLGLINKSSPTTSESKAMLLKGTEKLSSDNSSSIFDKLKSQVNTNNRFKTPDDFLNLKNKNTLSEGLDTSQNLSNGLVTSNNDNISSDAIRNLKNDENYLKLENDLEGTSTKSDSFIKENSGLIKGNGMPFIKYGLNDIERIVRDSFGKISGHVKANYLDPFFESKKLYANEVTQKSDELYNDVVKKLGIKKGSKESAAVQWYGEGKRVTGYNEGIDVQTGQKVLKPVEEEYDIGKLKLEFPNSWQKIVEADKWFRNQYDNYVDKINDSLKKIYPTVENQVEALKKKGMELDATISTKKSNLKNYEKQLASIDENIANKKAMLASWKNVNTIKYAELQKTLANLENRRSKFISNQIESTKSSINELAMKRNEITSQINGDELLKNKRLAKRKDYYRHFNEMTEGFAGLKNVFQTSAQIDPKLVGVSGYTKPNSKWAGFMQHQGKGEYKADAVGGFLDYLKPASYKVHIEQHIPKFRQLAKDIAEGSAEKNSKNANDLIRYFQNYANDLAGKTTVYDRVLTEDIIGRKVIKVFNWVDSRVKSNAVLGNVRSLLSQTASIPVGVARVKNPADLTLGAGKMLLNTIGKDIGKDKSIENVWKQSGFLSERFMDKSMYKFNTKLLDKPKDFAAWAMGAVDETSTKYIWTSAYQNALRKGITDPVKHADQLTRSVVAGRGVGEVPLLQKSKLFQAVAPFQLEVMNLWHVFGDTIKEKDFASLALLPISLWVFNEGMKNVVGDRIVFDPIGAVQDALNEENADVKTIAGRLGGEVLSNVPLGGLITETLITDETQREKILGRNDPTRFGTSGLNALKPFRKAITNIYNDNYSQAGFELATGIGTPFGGSQIRKTVQGAQALNMIPRNLPIVKQFSNPVNLPAAASQTKDGPKIKFPIKKDPLNIAAALMLSPYATREGKEYNNKQPAPLGTEQSKSLEYIANKKGSNAQALYDQYLRLRKLEALPGNKDVTNSQKKLDIYSNKNLSDTEKALMIKMLFDKDGRDKLLNQSK